MSTETRCRAGQSLRRGRWIAFMPRTYALPRHPLIFILDEIDSISLIGIEATRSAACASFRPRASRATKVRPQREPRSGLAAENAAHGQQIAASLMLRHKALLVCIAFERRQRGCRRVNPTRSWSGLTQETMRGAPGRGWCSQQNSTAGSVSSARRDSL